MIGAFLSLFGGKKKCYSCGGEYDVRQCACGRFYCTAHGFDGKCFKCQTKSIGTVIPSLETAAPEGKVTKTARAGVKESKGELIPRTIRASFLHDASDLKIARENLLLELERYRPVFFSIIRVESNHEITCWYHIQYISSRITLDRNSLGITTDLSLVPDRIYDKNTKVWVKFAKEKPLEDEIFTYLIKFLHNEILFLCELVLRSLGASVTEVENDLTMDMVSARVIGTCPWCGTICRGLNRCTNCRKEVPQDMDLRIFLKMHFKRHFMDKLIAVRWTKMEDTAKRRLISQIKSRLQILDRM